MSPFDPDLLRRLADADAALPPAPGREFSPASLRDLAARRTRRHVLVLLAASLPVALGICMWPRGAHADEETWRDDGMRALRAEVEAVRASLHEWSTARAATERAAADATRNEVAAANLRFELAQARAGAVRAGTAARAGTSRRPIEETNR
ncbi:MAG TPA: hypothetical protein VFD82_07910 [Planctomycetota bacterium]|nr:hypothetical protein [Planctomycetota bacterium]